jgi:Holliday junction resolvasome RuvABC endonuclease subunit
MQIVGLDYSMSCPAMTIFGDTFETSKCYFLTTVKKLHGSFDNVIGIPHKDYKNSMERYGNIANWVLNFIPQGDVMVFIEDYSLGSKGQVFSIAENTGIMKYVLYTNKISFQLFSPAAIKKDFTGKGNADKNAMYDAFVEKTNIDLYHQMHLVRTTKVLSPISDIVDSWAIANLGKKHHEHLVRW